MTNTTNSENQGTLCLTRKKGESILIADAVKVTIHQIKGGQVKILVQAPREIPIVRSELERKAA